MRLKLRILSCLFFCASAGQALATAPSIYNLNNDVIQECRATNGNCYSAARHALPMKLLYHQNSNKPVGDAITITGNNAVNECMRLWGVENWENARKSNTTYTENNEKLFEKAYQRIVNRFHNDLPDNRHITLESNGEDDVQKAKNEANYHIVAVTRAYANMLVAFTDRVRFCAAVHFLTPGGSDAQDTASRDGRIKCVNNNYVTQDFEACDSMRLIYDMGGLADEATTLAQGVDNELKTQDDMLDAATNPEDSLAAVRATKKLHERGAKYATQKAALKGVQAAALWASMEAMLTTGEVVEAGHLAESNGGHYFAHALLKKYLGKLFQAESSPGGDKKIELRYPDEGVENSHNLADFIQNFAFHIDQVQVTALDQQNSNPTQSYVKKSWENFLLLVDHAFCLPQAYAQDSGPAAPPADETGEAAEGFKVGAQQLATEQAAKKASWQARANSVSIGETDALPRVPVLDKSKDATVDLFDSSAGNLGDVATAVSYITQESQITVALNKLPIVANEPMKQIGQEMMLAAGFDAVAHGFVAGMYKNQAGEIGDLIKKVDAFEPDTAGFDQTEALIEKCTAEPSLPECQAAAGLLPIGGLSGGGFQIGGGTGTNSIIGNPDDPNFAGNAGGSGAVTATDLGTGGLGLGGDFARSAVDRSSGFEGGIPGAAKLAAGGAPAAQAGGGGGGASTGSPGNINTNNTNGGNGAKGKKLGSRTIGFGQGGAGGFKQSGSGLNKGGSKTNPFASMLKNKKGNKSGVLSFGDRKPAALGKQGRSLFEMINTRYQWVLANKRLYKYEVVPKK